jgi:hypothetical protein
MASAEQRTCAMQAGFAIPQWPLFTNGGPRCGRFDFSLNDRNGSFPAVITHADLRQLYPQFLP